MNRQQQDLAWACLPKEARDEIKREYNHTLGWSWDSVKNAFMENLYGHHNLTSDTEPEEMLTVERKTIIERYHALKNPDDESYNQSLRNANILLLQTLFGDKCLPDKEESVQVEHNYYKGDKVRISLNPKYPHSDPKWLPEMDKFKGHIVTLKEQDADGDWSIEEDAIGFAFNERWIEPYTESKPKFKIGDKVYQTVGHNRLDEYTIKKVYTDKSRGVVYDIQGLIGIIGIEENKLCLTCQNPYTEPETTRKDTQELSLSDKQGDENKDSMEEKELDLCELLKGCEGEKFFSLIDGEVKLEQLTNNVICQYHTYHLSGHLMGYALDGECLLYPSRALYEKYPLDAKKAWDEWASERKPKYILQAEIRLISKDGKNIEDYENVEVEVSDIDLTQAADGIREYLKSFHEKNPQ